MADADSAVSATVLPPNGALEHRQAETGDHPMQRNLEKLLTARDVAELTQLDVKTIYMYVQKGLIPYVRIQSSVRFYESEIRAWIEDRAYRPQSSMA